jgi:hypothetical protein
VIWLAVVDVLAQSGELRVSASAAGYSVRVVKGKSVVASSSDTDLGSALGACERSLYLRAGEPPPSSPEEGS